MMTDQEPRYKQQIGNVLSLIPRIPANDEWKKLRSVITSHTLARSGALDILYTFSKHPFSLTREDIMTVEEIRKTHASSIARDIWFAAPAPEKLALLTTTISDRVEHDYQVILKACPDYDGFVEELENTGTIFSSDNTQPALT